MISRVIPSECKFSFRPVHDAIKAPLYHAAWKHAVTFSSTGKCGPSADLNGNDCRLQLRLWAAIIARGLPLLVVVKMPQPLINGAFLATKRQVP